VKPSSNLRPELRWVLLATTLLFTPHALFAQGCALCYTQAANSPQRFVQALRSGILILMLPPMALSIVFAVMAYRRRNSFQEEPPVDPAISDNAAP
jgi:hypothetical protein